MSLMSRREEPKIRPKFKRSLTSSSTESEGSAKWHNKNIEVDGNECFSSLVSSSEDEEESAVQASGRNKSVQFSLETVKNINNISVTNNRAWIAYWNNNEVELVNKSGERRKLVSLDTIITDISFSMATDELWLCCRDRTIRERMAPDTARVAFKTKFLPLSICITRDGSVLVGMEFKVVKYDLNGRVLKTIDTVDMGGSQLIYPERIRQCSLTGRIGIADRAFVAWCGDGIPKVSVFDENFTFQFCYSDLFHVRQSTTYRHDNGSGCNASIDTKAVSTNDNSKKKNGNEIKSVSLESDAKFDVHADDYVNVSLSPLSLCPRDLCFGPQGQIIIADYHNKVVFSLSDVGKYQSSILVCDSAPCALDCDQKGNLWIGCRRKTVTVVTLPCI